jgi:hypothetical protein
LLEPVRVLHPRRHVHVLLAHVLCLDVDRLELADRRQAGQLFLLSPRSGNLVDVVAGVYEGRLAELPRPDAVREHNGITFHVYPAGGLTLVFWHEGAVVCVLASDAESEAVIQLAYAKAVKV